MARRRRHRSSGGRVVRHRRRSSGGRSLMGGRFGVHLNDAAIAAVAGAVGGAVQSTILSKWAGAPAFVQAASIESIGLYALGVAFNRPDFRSVGAGMALGKWAGIGVAAALP